MLRILHDPTATRTIGYSVVVVLSFTLLGEIFITRELEIQVVVSTRKRMQSKFIFCDNFLYKYESSKSGTTQFDS